MTTRITVTDPTRLQNGGSLAASDFDDIAGCESVEWLADGVLGVTFAADLTPEQRLIVRIRCISADVDQEQTLTAAAQAYYANLDFLAIPAPTGPQSIGQVRTLTQQINGLLRFVTRL